MNVEMDVLGVSREIFADLSPADQQFYHEAGLSPRANEHVVEFLAKRSHRCAQQPTDDALAVLLMVLRGVADADQARRALLRRKYISHDREEDTFTWFGGGVKSTRGTSQLSGPHRQRGTIELIADELVLTVNSAQRFEAARQWLAQLPGVTFQNVVTRKSGRNVNDIPADDRLNPARPVEITPEVADDIKSTFEQYYMQWLDTPLPVLGGKSPRQACLTRTGREQVTTLIRTMPDPVGPVKIQAPRESLLRALGLSCSIMSGTGLGESPLARRPIEWREAAAGGLRPRVAGRPIAIGSAPRSAATFWAFGSSKRSTPRRRPRWWAKTHGYPRLTGPLTPFAGFPRMQIFRIRFVLRMTSPARMHAHHAAILYALLAQAHGVSRKIEPCVPDGVLLDAPEQARLWLAQGSPYAFGLTLLVGSAGEAGRIADQLALGLRKVGRRKDGGRLALGGNFDVELVQDLVAGQTHRAGHPMRPIAREWIDDEIARAVTLPNLTLRFLSPLRAHRSKKSQYDGHQFFDREHFAPQPFVSRLSARLQGLGIDISEPTNSDGKLPTIAANRLVWLDLSYGPRHTRKALGGVVGRITLTNLNPVSVAALVWGQYVRIGEATRFGFGCYRVEELGPRPFACARGSELLSLAAEHPSLDEAAAKWELGGGEAREAARQLAAGDFEPRPHFRVEIPKSDGSRRMLCIPSRLDRVLQRAVLDLIAPAIDLFLEESSLAYRRGLGRHTAARRLKTAFAEGFRWALRADFLDFFDALDHDLLEERLAAYLGDDATVAVLMRWVRVGSPHEGRGIPTGAPLSPLLANLFLDEFDEAMEREGRRLVRYADDFVVLFRDRADADAVLADARRISTALQLELNRDKTRTLALDAPFDFLGFRFEQRESWELGAPDGPQPVEQLGWKERTRSTAGRELSRLPGESDLAAPLPGTLIAGPELEELLIHGENLQFKYRERRGVESVPLIGLREILVIGPVTLPQRVLDAVQRHSLSLLLVDTSGRRVTALESQEWEPDAAGVAAQVDASRCSTTRLSIARQLVAAKLNNYAALAAAYRRPDHAVECEQSLARLSRAAEEAQSLDELLGIEGSGAAKWFGGMGPRLPSGFTWERRIAPDAHDPTNILLNLAQTVLHRWMQHAIHQAKLVDSIGLLHVPRPGHAALASDMQEPFRHLMDRAVLETLRRIRPEDFELDERGPYPVRIKPRALRESLAWIHRILAQSCHGAGQSEPLPYRLHVCKQVRSLRRHLTTLGAKFEPFRHP